MKKVKQLLAVLLSVMMLIGNMPVNVFAEEPVSETVELTEDAELIEEIIDANNEGESPAWSISETTVNLSVNSGESVTLKIPFDEGSSTDGLKYYWNSINNPTYIETTEPEFWVDNINESTTYYCDVEDENGNYETVTFVITVSEPAFDFDEYESPITLFVNSGDSVTLQIPFNEDSNVSGFTFEWFKNEEEEPFAVTEYSYITLESVTEETDLFCNIYKGNVFVKAIDYKVCIKEHTDHSYVLESSTPATCTEDGFEIYKCTECDKEITEILEATGHSFTNYISDENATCLGNGTKTAYCDNGCGAIDIAEDEDSQLEHTPGEEVEENIVDVTCTENGSYDLVVYCQECLEALSRETVEIPATGHSFTKYVSDRNATFTEDGTKTATCDHWCGATDTITDEGSMLTDSGTCGDNLTWNFDESTGTLTISGTGKMYNYCWTDDGSMLAPWESIENITSVIIENGVTSIGNFAFFGCTNLSNVIIPNSVALIGENAFFSCLSLTSITIPDSVTSIESAAFMRCSLTSITIPDSVKSIESKAFFSCSDLSDITIEDGVTSIGYQAFYGCVNITEINLPDSITSIGSGAFMDCMQLTSVTIPDSITRIESLVFYGCSSLTSITVPDSVTSIGSMPFAFGNFWVEVTYLSTKANWQKIEGYENVDCKVICTDGVFGEDEKTDLSTANVTLGYTSTTYTGSAKKPTVKVKDADGNVLSSDVYTVTYKNNVSAGKASVTVKGDEVNTTGSKTVNFTIKKATPTVTAPVAKTGLKYTGSAQTLVTAGTTTGGTLQYALGENGTYSTTLPKATNAGSYKVYYKVVGNTNYNAVAAKYITVTVAKKTPTVTAPVAKKLTYTGSAQALVTAGTTTGGTLKYCLTSGGTYSTTIPKKTNVGIYKVYYKVVSNTNYNGTTAKSITVNILPKKATVSSYKNTNSGIKITWGKVTGATGYYVYRGTTKIKTITSGSTVTCTDAAVKDKPNATKYTYYVQAYYKNSAGTVIKGAKSTGKATYRMKAPASLTLTAGTKYITVTVPKVSGVGYEIYRSTSKTGTYTKVTATTSNTYKNTGLTSGKTYYYKVRTYKTINGTKVYSDYCDVKYAKAK